MLFLYHKTDGHKLPVFGQIVDIVLYDHAYVFILNIYESLTFNELMNCFVINQKKICTEAVLLESLIFYREPFEFVRDYDSNNLYVVPNYIFV